MAIAVMGDDETASSLILRLGDLGFDTIHARRGWRAFGTVLGTADVILCESISEAAATIGAAGRLPAPFILMTPTLPNARAMLSAMRHGIIDVVMTPVGDDELGTRIRAAQERAKPTDLRIAGQLDSLRRDQRAARYIQHRMLPPSPLVIGGYRLAHRVQPSMILSGDFVDYFRIADRQLIFYIADVSGHGASSAFVTVILKNFSRRLRREYRPPTFHNPSEVLKMLNRELMDQGLGKHVAMFMGVVDLNANTVTYANAGHFPHAIHAHGGCARFLEVAGKPVGLFEEVEYADATIPLVPGDSLVVFSDGVLEVMTDEGLAAKEARLVECAAAQAPDITALWRDVGIVDESPGPDDITCLMVVRET